MQGLWAGLPRGNEIVQHITEVFIDTAADLFYTWDLDPQPCHFTLQSYFHLWGKIGKSYICKFPCLLTGSV